MAVNELKNPKKGDKAETITELAHRHLKDETHTTTDEELRNAKLELTANVEADADNLYEVDNTPLTSDEAKDNNYNKDKDEKKEDNKDDKGDLPNPYTVLQ
ncbi:MAG: hypothetical protein H0X70_03250 [Segetibacter sp.]|jgi:hypothetical protein|nr:hypothetical protein [Segetibacter sp.]